MTDIEKLRVQRELVADLWWKVGKIKNPFPNYLSNGIERKKGFTKAKTEIRRLLFKELQSLDELLLTQTTGESKNERN